KFDVLVGINLLREGLDMPEVSLVAILDADKEGFLRSDTSLIQTIGRAARNAEGKVIMYADVVTDSMRRAIDETNRRRQVQQEYNLAHGIVPRTIIKPVKDLIELTLVAEESGEYKVDVDATARVAAKKLQAPGKKMTKKESEALLKALMKEMQMASRSLEFERAAQLRDMIFELEDAMGKKSSRKKKS
ncbi:helicase-related protein, partial [Anaerovibrio sp.]|uniref:helicase-related protein n=1 Tax=Anaerovibrio sp. TaxID=1872532 RepID=UPI00261A183B